MASKTKSGSSPEKIDVYIKLSSGKVVPMNVGTNTTIASLCAQLRGHESSVPSARLALKYQGEILSKSKTVGQYGVCKETVLRVEILASRTLNIFVKLEESSRVVPLTLESTNTVAELKEMIHAKEGIATHRQTLRSGSTALTSPLSSLEECGVGNESVLKLEVSSAAAAVTSSAALPEKDVAELNEDDKQDVLGSFAASFGSDQVVDVVFSFDTTGSMYSCLAEVRQKVGHTVERLLQDIPNIQIGIIAHGDYCDHTSSYVIRQVDLTSDTHDVVKFVRDVPQTGGGDCPECYEWVLVKAQKMSWRSNSAKALIVIGDALPHPASYTGEDISWRQELAKLTDMGVKVYGVQALSQSASVPFYKELARVSGGKYLKFANFSLITDMFLAVCYGASCPQQLQAYQLEVQIEGRMTDELGKVFEELTKESEVPEADEPEEEETDEKDDFKEVAKKLSLDEDFSSPNAVRQAWWSRDCDSKSTRANYRYDEKKDRWSNWASSSTPSSHHSTPPATAVPAAKKKPATRSFRRRASIPARRRASADVAPSREEIRIAVLGSAGVGKTSLLNQFTEKRADATARSMYRKEISHGGRPLALDIVASRELDGWPLNTCLMSCECFLVVYSVSDKLSFDDARLVCERVRRFFDAYKAPIVVVGNKDDVASGDHAISSRQGSDLAAKFGCAFLETSSRHTGKTEKAFMQLLRDALAARERMTGASR